MKTELDIYRTVKKSNVLNELRNANASLVEYRLFCVYLAHLSMNSDDNVVTFSLDDYARIAGLKRPRYDDLKDQSNHLLGMTAVVELDDGGFVNRNLFSEFRLFRENEQWMVSLECNPKIAPMIREQKGRFLRYKLYNTIYLKSFNQQRIYELLKQYQRIGKRRETLENLRAYLSVDDNEYPVWGDFSQKVLKVAQKALKERTDICFEYMPIKKRGKTVEVLFEIFENTDFKDPMEIDKFLPATTDVEYEGVEFSVRADDEQPADEQEAEAPRELTRKERVRLELIEAAREGMGSDYEFTDAEMEEIVVAMEQSEWWQLSKTALFGTDERVLARRHQEVMRYIEAQYVYTKSRSKAKTKAGFKTYLVKSVREYYWKYPVVQNIGFDADEFFDAATIKE